MIVLTYESLLEAGLSVRSCSVARRLESTRQQRREMIFVHKP
jgi:hypothetical protein